MDILPESIARDGDAAIVIKWTDGRTTRWTAPALRAVCPCATCREKKRADASDENQSTEPMSPKMSPKMALPVLKPAEAQPLSITSMRPVGAYAYNIAFSDGHSSGLFPLGMLYESGDA